MISFNNELLLMTHYKKAKHDKSKAEQKEK